MDYLVTFLEGVITFVSPCLLPMLPIYVAYFAGGRSEGPEGVGGDADGDGGARSDVRNAGLAHTAICALGFIIGFTALFTLLGALAGSLGSLFVRYRRVVDIVCGAIVIVLGLNYLGVLRIPALQRSLKPRADVVPRGFASSLLFGVVFAIGWTPCVGAFLGSALSLAAQSGEMWRGVALLISYSLGLGVPFFACALLIDQLEGAFSWVKAHYGIVDKICGAFLVVVGVLMATGTLGAWLSALSFSM